MKNQLNILLKEVCEKGLAKGVFPGVSAAVSVWKNNEYHRGIFSGGLTRKEYRTAQVNDATYFDLASLTKPLCTTLSTLSFIDSGILTWHEPCLGVLDPSFQSEKRGITCHNILHHSSGLPAYNPYFSQFAPVSSPKNKVAIRDLILAEPFQYKSDTQCLYSDLGFIVLGQVMEKLTGSTLDHFYRTTILTPLHLEETLKFIPVNEDVSLDKNQIAATEKCDWRHTVMQGEVHDEHCWLMGGVSGHAGLFGTVGGVQLLCEFILDCWHGRKKHPAFGSELLCYALQWSDGENSWRLGFDSPSTGQSSSGRYLSPRSVGHLGFTGTSFWIDPEQGIVVVLLTNRVHPTRENLKIRAFRPFFHDYLIQGIHRMQ
jgi:serine-type D-Ala-D-Ala carboxypeptidase